MDLLKRLLIDSEFNKGIANVDDFIKDNNINDDAMIQSIIFNKINKHTIFEPYLVINSF